MSADGPTLRLIRPEERIALPGPPGAPFVREQILASDHTWVGVVTTEVGAASPWHHHGAHHTYAWVLEGEATVEFGAGGAHRLRATADGSLGVIPPGVVHREVNTGDVPNRILIVRVGEGPPVFPVDGPD